MMRTAPSFGFYDPLYEYIAVDRDWQFDEHVDLVDFINTIEFTRQLFLRQSGASHFVFPSATHSRFSHALGACHLGFVAAPRIRVRDGVGGRPMTFGEFVRQYGWSSAFSISLLLHDVGHFAFSHLLERNWQLWSILSTDHGQQRLSHEEASCSLLSGSGPFFKAAKRHAQSLPAGIRAAAGQVSVVLRRVDSKDRRLLSAVSYLITCDETYLKRFSDSEKQQLKVVKELVSGLLDLDRIDHYRRDIFFNGLRPGTGLNYMSLLDGITVVHEDGPRNGDLVLSGDAFGQAVALLQMKQRLHSDVFQNPAILSNEAMLNRAVALHVRNTANTANDIFDLLYSTDDELLFTLAEGDREVSDIVHRMKVRLPYAFVGRIECTDWHRRDASKSRATTEEIVQMAMDDVEPGLLFTLTGPWSKSTQRIQGLSGTNLTVPIPGEEWLQHGRIEIDADRSLVIDQLSVRQQLQGLHSDRSRHIWLFRREALAKTKAEQLVRAVRDRLLESEFRS